MLTKVIAEAEAIYRSKVRELQPLQALYRRRKGSATFPLPDLTADTMEKWLAGITHVTNGNHRKKRTYASAYGREQQIVYNPLFTTEADHEELLDTVLHEMGHLFQAWFFGRIGHQDDWRHVGQVVGYAPVGSTSDSRRKRYRSYARYANTVSVPEAPVGRVSAYRENGPRNYSTAVSPVKQVWEVCDMHGRDLSRKEIIGLCVRRGINRNTASTQYYHWKKQAGL